MDYDPPPAIAAPFEDGAKPIEISSFVKTGPRCPRHEPGEIVVCAQDTEKFRLRPLPESTEEPVPRSRAQISDRASVGAELESAGVGGQVSNRVMVRGRLKF